MKKLLLFILSFILILNISISTFASPEYSQKNEVEIYTSIPYKHKYNLDITNSIKNNTLRIENITADSNIEVFFKKNTIDDILKPIKDITLRDISKSLNKDTIIDLINLFKNPYLHDYFEYIGRAYKNDILLKTSDDSYSEILIMLIILSLACTIKCIYIGKKNKK